MAKAYGVEYVNGFKQEFTARQCNQAKHIVNHDGTKFFLEGVEVDAIKFFEAVHAACEAGWEKKAETHKRVKVLHGSSVACYVEKWVRK